MSRERGVDGFIVSNQGGRQLDGARAPFRALPAVVAQANGMTVMLDGGIRRGTDVLKALALGAQFVFVGRPFLVVADAGGAAFVLRVLPLLKGENDLVMAVLRIPSTSEVSSDPVGRFSA